MAENYQLDGDLNLNEIKLQRVDSNGNPLEDGIEYFHPNDCSMEYGVEYDSDLEKFVDCTSVPMWSEGVGLVVEVKMEVVDILVMCFIDEASDYINYPYFQEDDLDSFNELSPAQRESPVVLVIPSSLSTSSGTYEDVSNGPEYEPENTTYYETDRPVPLSKLKEIYNNFSTNAVFIRIDESGSLIRVNLEPEIDDFITWLEDQGVEVTERMPYGERWIQWAKEGIQMLASE